MKRIYIGPNSSYQYRKGIKKRLHKEITSVNIVYHENIQRQRYNCLKKIISCISRACMIILLIFTLFRILNQNQVWYVQ